MLTMSSRLNWRNQNNTGRYSSDLANPSSSGSVTSYTYRNRDVSNNQVSKNRYQLLDEHVYPDKSKVNIQATPIVTPACPVVQSQQTVQSQQLVHTAMPIIKDRVSIGIACCRLNEGRPEILLICKRYTYAYYMFVHGKYNSTHVHELINLFNGMTVDEKLDILSLNFVQIWYRIWLNSSHRGISYFTVKNKFESTFAADGGVKLRKIMSKSTVNACRIWEIPKGRRKGKTEADIHCAIREFYEETGIMKKNYKMYNATRTYSYIDDGTRYTNIYYIASTRHNIEPRVNFGLSDQLDEISDIRWMNIESIRHIDDTKRLEKFIKPIFRYIKTI